MAAPLRAPQPHRLGAAARNIALVLGGQAGLSVSRFASLLLLSHLLPTTRFGECAIYVSSSLVLGNICELGINISCLKFAAEATGAGWLRTVSRFLFLRLCLTAVVIGPVLLTAPFLSLGLLNHPEYTHALRLAAASAALSSVSAFTLVLLQSRLEFQSMARQNGAAAILQILPVLVALQFGVLGVSTLFAGDLLSRLWIVAANSGLLCDAIKARTLPGPRPGWWSIATFANWITLSTCIGALYNYIPSIVLSRWNTPRALGSYSLGMSLAGGFGLLLNTTSTVLLPEAVSADTPAHRHTYLRAYLPGTAILGATLLALTWLLGPLADRLFPATLPGAVRVFQLLSTAHIALLVANPVQFLLYGAGRPQWCTLSDGLITGLFGTLAVWLAPSFGAIGVAWALLLSQTGIKTATVAAVLRR